ncbi:MAG: molybdenum cofactor biosynthesis protein MoaE [Lysobacterales bacterium]
MSAVALSAAFLSATPLDTAELRRSLERFSAGAVVVFEGVVRDHHEGKSVLRLEYSAFEAAVEVAWSKLRENALANFDVTAIAGQHRVGTLDIGESAVWIGVAAAHRGAAFAACQWLIDEAKRELPIWKREHYADGNIQWRHEVALDHAFDAYGNTI